MHIYFGLGSNLGDRMQDLRDAAAKLPALGRIVRGRSVREEERHVRSLLPSGKGGRLQRDCIDWRCCVQICDSDVRDIRVIERKMTMHIYFALGSNLGDRMQNLRDAAVKLDTLGQVQRVSSVWETLAWGGVPQPDYLNACVMIEGEFPPLELLRRVKVFEAELGRVPSVRWGERKIDIDVLLMGDMVFHSEELDIPHIRIPERKFVLVPLGEIVPEGWVHPVNGKSVNEMLAELTGEGEPVRVGSLV